MTAVLPRDRRPRFLPPRNGGRSGWGPAAVLAVRLLRGAAAAAPITVTASVENYDVVVGQPFGLNIAINGAQNVPVPELGTVDGFRADYLGPSTQVSFVNGVVTTRKFLKSNEDTVRRFLRAYIEGAVRGMKDKAFAMKTMGKYFRTDDREVLEETYEMVIKNAFNVPPHPAGIASLLLELEKTVPKAKTAKPEEFADSRLVKELDESGFIKSVLAGK